MGQREMRLQDAGVDGLALQTGAEGPSPSLVTWGGLEAKLLWAEPAQGPGNPEGHRPRLRPLLSAVLGQLGSPSRGGGDQRLRQEGI